MICQTIRKGSECALMTTTGCSYKGGLCHEIIESCQGCNRAAQIESGWYCSACPEPSIKWKNGNCNLATHVVSQTAASKAKINPLKASKRGNR
ncbi:MAG: hypothetical protein HKP58_19660 [Desulfatitalea sp.]|nr:PxxKW family cysteine-rich protein [Desulfatitalea sp.]NNK02634.1 hypothetical protein [Desulfatitalea sp.]